MESSAPSNPYSTPAAAPATPPPDALYFRQDNILLIRDGAALPPRCIKTNRPAEPKDWTKQVPLSWTPPWVYIFALFGLLPMLLLAVVASKKAKLTYTLSREERGRLMKRKSLAALGFFGGLAILIAGLAYLDGSAAGSVAIIATILMIGSLVVIAVTNAITVQKHKDGWFTIKGCSPEFLNSL